MESKYFKCYCCHYHNNFFIPKKTKGKRCKNCGTFNYFNFKRKNRNYAANNINRSFSRLENNYSQNQIRFLNNNYIRNQNRFLNNNDIPNQNGFLFNNYIPNQNIFLINNNNINQNRLLFNNNNKRNTTTNSFNTNNSSSILFNNQINYYDNNNINNINYDSNSNDSKEEDNEFLYDNYSNKYYWLTKQKATKEYIDSECTTVYLILKPIYFIYFMLEMGAIVFFKIYEYINLEFIIC